MIDPSTLLDNACQPEPGLLTGGQPSRACLEAARNAGYRTVVNLRPTGEFTGFDEGSVVRKLGLDYVNIPVAGADGLNAAAVESIDAVLTDQRRRPVLIHCSTGNRAGALIAMDACRKSDHALAIDRVA
ncbi:MAG: hypothetical protein EPN69_08380 [Rhodanobacter sp.]|nr:MAG: hypothetical protein EPN69_08380 [Rhodanobacter sp.]TAM39498.1 MAG: hypothetical protein EPN58_13525 [Rhodanobacter sp.]TAN29069.1 MAG: hypothetical protein EPN32_01595 [Rhodanobacter sp.]